MAFSFLHIADVHLDTPFENKDSNIRKKLREKLRGSFYNAASAAINNKVDALLIAGDLFDNDTLSFATEKFIVEQMERLNAKGIRVFYASGNHDPSGANYRISRIKWPDNVYIFKSAEPEIVVIHDDHGAARAVVAGAGHQGSLEGRDLASGFPNRDENIPYIGLLHSCVMGRYADKTLEKYAPCTLTELIDKNYSYWALGHIHIMDIMNEYPDIAYSGCTCGRNPKETGIKGGLLVQIDGEVKKTFIPLSDIVWETLNIEDISKAVSFEQVLEQIVYEVQNKMEHIPGEYDIFLRIVLSGTSVLFSELQNEDNLLTLEDELKYRLNIEYVQIKADNLVRPIKPDDYRSEPHLLGEALAVIDEMKNDSQYAFKLKPEKFAGLSSGADQNEMNEYIEKLLDGLDYELCARLLEGERK